MIYVALSRAKMENQIVIKSLKIDQNSKGADPKVIEWHSKVFGKKNYPVLDTSQDTSVTNFSTLNNYSFDPHNVSDINNYKMFSSHSSSSNDNYTAVSCSCGECVACMDNDDTVSMINKVEMNDSRRKNEMIADINNCKMFSSHSSSSNDNYTAVSCLCGECVACMDNDDTVSMINKVEMNDSCITSQIETEESSVSIFTSVGDKSSGIDENKMENDIQNEMERTFYKDGSDAIRCVEEQLNFKIGLVQPKLMDKAVSKKKIFLSFFDVDGSKVDYNAGKSIIELENLAKKNEESRKYTLYEEEVVKHENSINEMQKKKGGCDGKVSRSNSADPEKRYEFLQTAIFKCRGCKSFQIKGNHVLKCNMTSCYGCGKQNHFQ